MLGIYRFHWCCGRQGDLNGLFVADDSTIEQVFGAELYFGEVLGKHSEVCGTLEPGDITALEATEEEILVIIRILQPRPCWKGLDTCLTLSGYNPIAYIPEEDRDGNFNQLLIDIGVPKNW